MLKGINPVLNGGGSVPATVGEGWGREVAGLSPELEGTVPVRSDGFG